MAMSNLSPLEHFFVAKSTNIDFSEKDGFCYEWIRLQSFVNWPTWAVGFPSLYAKAGFYYTSVEDQVVCFSCDLRIGNWRQDMDPVEEHKARNSSCQFLAGVNNNNIPIQDASGLSFEAIFAMLAVGKSETGVIEGAREVFTVEIPCKSAADILTSSTSPQQVTDSGHQLSDFHLKMKEEVHRMETYHSWPKPEIISAKDLAESGLYYTGVGDLVKCAFCDGTLEEFQLGDVANDVHILRYPTCQFARECSRSRHLEETLSSLAIEEGFQNPAKNPRFASLRSRIETFRTWPTDKSQEPQELAEAGFIYAGMADCVKCFHCNGGLRNWLQNDDPLVEHVRWFPECEYARKQQEIILEEITKEKLKLQPTSVYLEEPNTTVITITESSPNVEVRPVSNHSPTPEAAAETPVQQAPLQQREVTPSPRGSKESRTNDKPVDEPNSKKQSSADGKSDNDPDVHSLAEENRELQQKTSCKICLTEMCQLTFLPCGHLVACIECGKKLRKCPICRSVIKGRVRIYMA